MNIYLVSLDKKFAKMFAETPMAQLIRAISHNKLYGQSM